MRHKLKILVISETSPGGTGSATYSSQVVTYLKGRHDIVLANSIADCKGDFDLVHVLDIKHFDPTLLRFIKCPLVVDVHDCYWIKGESFFPTPDMPIRIVFSWRRRKRYSRILSKASAVVVHSKYVLSRLEGRKGYVVPYSVEELERGARLEKRPPLVIFAGRDYFRKGLPVLLKAWEHVRRIHAGARLIVAGREYSHERFYFRRFKRDKSISFLGAVERGRLLDYMREARAVVLPSWTEAFGIVLIEAMACGAVPIGTNCEGIAEALRHGEAGLLIEKGNATALAKAILRTLDDDPRLDDIIEKGKQVVSEHSVRAMIDSLESVYQEVLSEG